MRETRSSSKRNGATAGAPESKRKAEGGSSRANKRSRKSLEKNQTTIEESLGGNDTTPKSQGRRNGSGAKPSQQKGKRRDTKGKQKTAVEAGAREAVMPSTILEKGIVYFFFRGRVDVDAPQEVDDIARSFVMLRPVDRGAKLGAGPIGDAGNSRLCALPKKVLPLSGKDRFMAFVEKAGASFAELRDDFLSGSDYLTKTKGPRHSPAATPIGEGIYSITSTGRESHLAYMLTLPRTLGEVQRDMGLRERGSFIISTKNPAFPGPAGARLPQGPDYPDDIQAEFRSLRWLPTRPKHLDFVNTQFLLIGESSGLDKAMRPAEEEGDNGKSAGGDSKEEEEEPIEEMEKLEDEDAHRMKKLGADEEDDDDGGGGDQASAAIFADLEASASDYPRLQTTFK